MMLKRADNSVRMCEGVQGVSIGSEEVFLMRFTDMADVAEMSPLSSHSSCILMPLLLAKDRKSSVLI